ncbi:MAG: CapA family protein [Dehalococcoidia bacterium]|nr:MAG: CapA family protein [Dehalococcoidia bacterium]
MLAGRRRRRRLRRPPLHRPRPRRSGATPRRWCSRRSIRTTGGRRRCATATSPRTVRSWSASARSSSSCSNSSGRRWPARRRQRRRRNAAVSPSRWPALLFGGALALVAAACGGASASSTATPTSTAVPPTATAVPSPTPVPVTQLLFTGDLIPARCTLAKIRALGGDFTLPFRPLHDQLASADITIGTLDATLSDAGTPFGCIATFSLAGPAAAVDGLRYAGYDVIANAANHIKDCGVSSCGDDALLQTDDNLRVAGIKPAGTGRNLVEARSPAVVTRNGIAFAFLAYDDIAPYYHATSDGAGAAPLDPDTIAEDVANARKVANVVIVVPHWGVEYTTSPSERQRAFARAAAAAGADMVVGNHPHWVQAHERIGGTFVAYALGNFVFDQDWSVETQQGALLEATFTGTRLTSMRYIAIRIHDDYQPQLAAPPEAQQILDRIEAASAALP